MPAQVTTGFGTCKSGPVKNNGGTIVNAGNVNDGMTNNLNLESITSQTPFYASKMTGSVSPSSSGNVGHGKATSSVAFGNPNSTQIIDKVTTTIGGSSNTIMQSMGGDTVSRRPIGRYYAAARYDVRSFNIFPGGSGKATLGGGAGADVLASGINGVTGFYADTSVNRRMTGVPARLVFMFGGPSASGANYSNITQP